MLLFSVVAHERAHATAAYREGDDTAYLLGRTTWNPLKHLDPIMSLAAPVLIWIASGHRFTFGAAKPVPVNPAKFRNYRRGDIVVSLAGVATNLAIFVCCAVLYVLVHLLGPALPAVAHAIQQMLWWGVTMNLILAFFNLIPVPPLDGSHVLYHLLPARVGAEYRKLSRLGYLPILALSYLAPGVMGALLWPAFQLMDITGALIRGFTVGGAIA